MDADGDGDSFNGFVLLISSPYITNRLPARISCLVLRACKGILHQLLNRRRGDAGDLDICYGRSLQYRLTHVIAVVPTIALAGIGRGHPVSRAVKELAPQWCLAFDGVPAGKSPRAGIELLLYPLPQIPIQQRRVLSSMTGGFMPNLSAVKWIAQ